MYVIKVHPTKALLEMDYFIKSIENAESKRDEEIQRAEAGIEDDLESIQGSTMGTVIPG